MASILDRHADKWTPEPNTGCYLWTAGSLLGKTSRPMVRVDGKMQVVARLVCEEVHGSPPLKHDAAHNTPNGCVGGLCVNGGHLRWASRQENQLDVPVEQRLLTGRIRALKLRRERWDALQNGLVLYYTGKPCPKGHVVGRYKNGGCKICIKEDTARRRREKNK